MWREIKVLLIDDNEQRCHDIKVVLDFIGDIYLLGFRVRGSFEIFKGGHRLTHELAKSIMSDKSNWNFVYENVELDNLSFSTSNQKKELSASL